MADQYNFSDEMLNSYIDGELGDDDARLLLEQLQYDDALSERLAHLREIKDMLKMSYAGIEPPQQCAPCEGWRIPKSVAAGVLLLLGAAIGWNASSLTSPPSIYNQFAGKQSADGVWRIVMHANLSDEFMQNAMLEETENFLRTFKQNNQEAEVEIVAYGAGLSLLMADRSAHAERIASMQHQYKNLRFTACKRTMARMAEVLHDDIELLPDTYVATSGISQILKRQQEGWHYIRL